MDAIQLRTAGSITSRMIDGRVHNVPNWSIWSASKDTMLAPLLNDDGQLRSDYLLITVLPNIFSRKSYESGNRIVIFGGTHGVGTKAIDLLFRDSQILRHLQSKVKTSPYWQALFKVDQVTHDPIAGRAEAFSLAKDFECAPVHFKSTSLENHLRI